MSVQLDTLVRLQSSTYIHAATLAMFVYDYLLTVSDEVEHVWLKPQKVLGRALFFLNRYLGFIDLPLSLYTHVAREISDDRCQHNDTFVGALFFCGILVSELIMMLRLWILWGQTRGITIFLATMAVITMIFCIVSVMTTHSGYELISLGFLGLSGCYPIQGSALSPIIPIIGLVNETILLVLTMVACRRYSRFKVSSFLKPSSMIDMFARDGTIYYVLIVAVAIVNVYFTTDENYSGILPTLGLQRCLNSILVSRIFIYLRQQRLTDGHRNLLPVIR